MGSIMRQGCRLRNAKSDMVEFGMGQKASTSSAPVSAMQLYKDVNFEEAQRKHAQWVSMFGIKVLAGRSRKSEPDVLLEAAQQIATSSMREHVTLPGNPDNLDEAWEDLDSGGRLPPVSCAFRGCGWCGGGTTSEEALRHDFEHPWDQQLRNHVLSTHGRRMQEVVESVPLKLDSDELSWALYKQALAVQERKTVPRIGVSVERRVFDTLTHVYQDDCIRALICFACAQIKVDTGGLRSKIKFMSGSYLFSLPKGSLKKNFCLETFTERYCNSASPLARKATRDDDQGNPDFSNWYVSLHPKYLQMLSQQPEKLEALSLQELQELRSSGFLCCPEDHYCTMGCPEAKLICPNCQIALCRDCMYSLQANEMIPQGLPPVEGNTV